MILVSYDCGDWMGFAGSRFVQYQWFNELNTEVSSIDDDGQTLPTGSITYPDHTNNPEYHGNHVAGTCAEIIMDLQMKQTYIHYKF